MLRYTLMLEDHQDVFPASLEHLQLALHKMASSTGPTFLNLKDEGGSWAQFGGTNGRYRVEARDVYGEGFRHWVAFLPGCVDRSSTVVYYRNQCVQNKHAPRRCPLSATVANVLSLSDATTIMITYLETGERSAQYGWEDVSQSWLEQEAKEDNLGIKTIRPKSSGGPNS